MALSAVATPAEGLNVNSFTPRIFQTVRPSDTRGGSDRWEEMGGWALRWQSPHPIHRDRGRGMGPSMQKGRDIGRSNIQVGNFVPENSRLLSETFFEIWQNSHLYNLKNFPAKFSPKKC